MAIDPFEHVVDSNHFEIFDSIHWAIELPGTYKFMLMEAIAAFLMVAIYVPVARRISTGEPPRGRFLNAAEALLLFIRDQVARPSIGHAHEDGHHEADKFLPYLWTVFLFVLLCNLLGILPFLASPTASIMVTGVLALCSFLLIHGVGFYENGFGGYLKSFVPHIDLDTGFLKLFGPFLIAGIALLEVLSAFIRAFVLAVRLFANMMAGHTVLFVLLLFIRMVGQAADSGGPWAGTANALFWPITIGSVAMATALSVLELFVAGLQAFIFTFLTAVFIGLAAHPEH